MVPSTGGITSYGATYRDYLTLVHGWICGRFTDGEIANAANGSGAPMNETSVVYANGTGGYPIGPVGQDAERVANAALGGTAPGTRSTRAPGIP
jgi:hypothetical protein